MKEKEGKLVGKLLFKHGLILYCILFIGAYFINPYNYPNVWWLNIGFKLTLGISLISVLIFYFFTAFANGEQGLFDVVIDNADNLRDKSSDQELVKRYHNIFKKSKIVVLSLPLLIIIPIYYFNLKYELIAENNKLSYMVLLACLPILFLIAYMYKQLYWDENPD